MNILKQIYNLFLRNRLQDITLVVFVITILILSIRGVYGVPNANDLIKPEWRDNGPLELSPERGRYALTYSIVEDKSLFFSIPLAQFVVPDLGYINGRYVSLFAPGVSLIVLPGYIVGRFLGISQVGTFFVISLFALFNVLLIGKIGKLLGASTPAAKLSGLIFLFATPAYAYSINLYQHHISTFLLLAALYLLIKYNNNWKSLSIVFLICALSLTIDYPNFFMFVPIGIYALSLLVKFRSDENKINFAFNPLHLLTILSMGLPIGLFMYYNSLVFGGPTKLSGNIPSVIGVDSEGKPSIPQYISTDQKTRDALLNPETQEKSSVSYFKTRNILRGTSVHLFGKERGVLFYAPIVFLGILGLVVNYKKYYGINNIIISIILINLLVYSMWGDPWGGWAFGSRYLIPSYALLSVYLAGLLTKFNRNIVFLAFFVVTLLYSTAVNTLGAITTSAIPPKGNAQALEQYTHVYERYSYDRNWEFLQRGHSKSFFYNTVAKKYLTAAKYYYLLLGTISCVLITATVLVYKNKVKDEN